MTSINISLNSVDKVKTFVNAISKYDGDFDLSSGRYVVDAKSIMGIFSLNLSAPLKLDIFNENDITSILAELEEFQA
ncbi:MAG: PTS sugar transporter [Epulopiscium sp. Nele67-Bin002]|nr:MAG: PTS sugar transporter [Epulopiscium sp. Nuni2H_MBin001]OON90253.1 MAG: PTS sugar transporter [Epulopiscium sp. Nele67-Bin001]OON92322.1 MAG: PTS sugar transporter [Epulopiscium sp. Nele67-Bin002]